MMLKRANHSNFFQHQACQEHVCPRPTCSCTACALMNSAVRFHIIIQPCTLWLPPHPVFNSCLPINPLPTHPFPLQKPPFPLLWELVGDVAGSNWGAGWERPSRLDMSRCLRHKTVVWITRVGRASEFNVRVCACWRMSAVGGVDV